MAQLRTSLPVPVRLAQSSLLSAILLLSACSHHRPIGRGLAADAEEMGIRSKKSFLTDRVRWIRFGSYRTDRIRKVQEPCEWDGRLGRARLHSEARYEFQLADGAGKGSACSCLNRAERVDFFPEMGPVRELGYRISLHCSFAPTAGGTAWTLDLEEADSSGGVLRGSLGDGDQVIVVSGIRGYGGGFGGGLGSRSGWGPSHTGFRFQDGTEMDVAALDLLGKSRLLMSRDADPGLRDAMAGATVALFLYEDLSERIKDEVQVKLIHGFQVFSSVRVD